jgi:hypothetical protein
MSVTLLQGTFSGSSTTKARDLRQAWAGAFSGVTGWDLLDHDYVNGTSERSVIVNTTENFALMLYNSTTTTDLRLRIAFGRTYDDTTHVLSNIAFWNQTTGLGVTNFTSNSDALTGQTFNPNSITATINAVHEFKQINATSGQSDWTVHISDGQNQNAILTFNDGTTNIGKAIYFGEYKKLIANPAITVNNPYVCSIVASDSVPRSGLIETSGNALTTLQSWRFPAVNFWLRQAGAPADTNFNDFYSADNDKTTVSPIFLSRQDILPLGIDANLYGWLIGEYNNIVFARAENANWGDTLTFNGKTYMLGGKKSGTGALAETWWVEV